MNRVVTISDSTIMQLVADAALASAIPCFMGKKDIFQSKATGCGMCQKKREQKIRKELATIKTCIAGLSAEAKLKIKQKLNADEVRIVYTNLAGKVVQLTF